jgi:hypothetical protein
MICLSGRSNKEGGIACRTGSCCDNLIRGIHKDWSSGAIVDDDQFCTVDAGELLRGARLTDGPGIFAAVGAQTGHRQDLAEGRHEQQEETQRREEEEQQTPGPREKSPCGADSAGDACLSPWLSQTAAKG